MITQRENMDKLYLDQDEAHPMLYKTIKSISIVLVLVSTVLLIFNFISLKLLFTAKNNTIGFMPDFLIKDFFVAYPAFLLTAYILFIISRNIKTKIDPFINILFALNGLVLLLFFILY